MGAFINTEYLEDASICNLLLLQLTPSDFLHFVREKGKMSETCKQLDELKNKEEKSLFELFNREMQMDTELFTEYMQNTVKDTKLDAQWDNFVAIIERLCLYAALIALHLLLFWLLTHAS